MRAVFCHGESRIKGLIKLETYRLYQAGYAVADIGEAFGYAPGYLYELWGEIEKGRDERAGREEVGVVRQGSERKRWKRRY